jgi:predicted RNA-binding protein with TRAM domain
VLALLAGPGGSRLAALDAVARRRFFLVPAGGNGHVHLDHFEVLAQGKLETLRPEAPVEEGGTVELKLVEVGLYDSTAAVGKLDGGYEVVVTGAAKLVGKKVKATVGAVLEGAAYATLSEDGVAASTPITFEAEAEKPTRAVPSRKAPAAAEPEPSEQEDEDATAEAYGAEPEAAGDAAPKKKRTRRGTRGGRGRKKPAAAQVAESAGEGAVDNGRPAPRIHVPPADLAASQEPEPEAASEPEAETGDEAAAEAPTEDGQPKRKRSRRGSRGGRKRKKPAASADDEMPSEDDAPAVETAGDNGEPEYVPMSEWIDDFEARTRG